LAGSGVPAELVAPVVIVAVYTVPYAKLAAGVNVAVTPLYVTVPATAAPPVPVTVNVEALIEAGLMDSLKVALST
jgi:hypothetical protein